MGQKRSAIFYLKTAWQESIKLWEQNNIII